MESILTKSQFKTFTKAYLAAKPAYRTTITIRYDDQCGNGHNTFSITGQIDERRGSSWVEHSGGCIHNEIEKHFPNLRKYIKWHLVSSDGPLHYVANTLWHVEGKDYNGLRAGETRQATDNEGVPLWHINHGNTILRSSSVRPDPIEWEPYMLEFAGSPTVDLDAARRIAVWPDATDDDLLMPGLKERLLARLPKLMEEFRRDVEELGFTF